MKSYNLLTGLMCSVLAAQAQQNFTLYPMRSIPQSHLLNPANTPDCKWHIGIPALNSTYLQYSNGGFNLNKFFSAVEPSGTDTTVLNLNKLLDIMSKKNYIAFKVEQSWLQGGFKFQNHYFHGSIIEKANVRISLPKDLFRFVIDGNGGANLGQTFSLAPKAEAIHYREFALGYTYALPGAIQIGGRVKYLKGFNVLQTKSLVADITTDPTDYAYNIKANIEINSASSFRQLLPTNGSDTVNFGDPNFFKSNNSGLGFDLGASWQIKDKLTLNASILDMGFITWNQNTVSYVSRNPNAVFRYDGIKISSGDTQAFESYFQKLGDTLLQVFAVDTVKRTFRTALSTEFFIGGQYQINKRSSAGALFYGDFYNKRFYPGLSLNYQYKVGKALSFNVTNTMYNRSLLNVGLGVSVNAGPWQVYSVMDNVLFPFAISSLKTFSWRFGSNLTFGRERLKPKKSKPDGAEKPADIDPNSI